MAEDPKKVRPIRPQQRPQQQQSSVDIQTMIQMTTDAYKKAKNDVAIMTAQYNTLMKAAKELDNKVNELKAVIEGLEWEISEMEKTGAKRPKKPKTSKPKAKK